MEKLTKEEVLHVANLARIAVDEDEIERYSIELKTLIDDIDKIKDIENETDELLVTPTDHESRLRSDSDTRTVEWTEIQQNLPSSIGKFVEVPVIENE